MTNKKLEKLRKSKDTYLTKYVFKQIELIKEILNIPKNSRIYFLGYSRGFNYFLYKNKVIISSWNCERDIKQDYIVDTMEITDLYTIALPREEYPYTNNWVEFRTIKQTTNSHGVGKFMGMCTYPSIITIEVDSPYYKVIKFLQSYNLKTFKTDNFLFYPKKDNEFCYTLNFYAKDIKNNTELKLYVPNKSAEQENGEWKTIPPQKVYDILIDDLGNNISNYQKLKCKKEFLKLANQYCNELDTKNFFALELVKQTIQPVEYDSGWAVCRIFAGKNKFNNIWISDFMLKDEEPYFMITDSKVTWGVGKIACIDIKTATYHKARIKGNIYKQGIVKFKNWELDEECIKELIEFLKSPCDEIDKGLYTKEFAKIYSKYVKTNWQHLIFEYNHNTAGWGWDENRFNLPPDESQGQIPFDLPIPDYMELLNDKD